MSAIWGIISLEGKSPSRKHIELLKKAYEPCAIDRYEELFGETVYMGVGIQYFTREAEIETGPKRDEGIYFNSDVILDNREELTELLQLPESEREIPDGDILYRMFRQYGTDGLGKIVGAYTFVAYDSKRNMITIASDAVGYRFVHYMLWDGFLYYSSLMKPLQQIIGSCQMNRRWIADFIGQDNLNMFTECEETPIRGIYRVAPAQYITVSRESEKKIICMQKYIYWNPFKTKKLRLKSNEEYKQYFLDLYRKCVHSVLRSSGQTSILLSGGYDSTSVAVLAAEALDKEGKKLYGFTSVPFRGYESEYGADTMTDETEAVLKTKEYIPNLECCFMDMPEMNCWYDRKGYERLTELPYKSPQNLLWMYEGYRRSAEIGSKVLLGGMFGNGTVSYDNAQIYLRDLLRKGKLKTLYNEIVGINKMHFYTKKSVLRTTIRQALTFRKKTNSTRESLFAKTFAKKEFLERYGAVERLYQRQHQLEKAVYAERKYHEAMLMPDIFRHYGEFALRNSLYTGVIVRDPTRDMRMVEFVMSIPPGQFTHNGYMRALISDYMKDYVPEHIIRERRTGRQSADLKARLISSQEKIRQEWMENYRRYADNPVIDCDRAVKSLEGVTLQDMPEFDIVRHIFTNILLEYLDENQLK